jgi:RNA polymerase sigma-70 factor (ECF subfamily)
VYGNIARKVGIDRAEDLTSEVFIRAFDSRARYNLNYPSAKPWLLGIARHVQLNELRGTYRLRNHVVDNPDAEAAVPDFAEDVIEAQHLTSILRDESLVNAVNSLHPDIRETLLMFAIDEMSYVEVATALDVPLGTVRSRLGRARRAVREQTRDLMAIGDVPTRVDVKDDSDDA